MSSHLGYVLREARNSSAFQLGESECGLNGVQAPLSSTLTPSCPASLINISLQLRHDALKKQVLFHAWDVSVPFPLIVEMLPPI